MSQTNQESDGGQLTARETAVALLNVLQGCSLQEISHSLLTPADNTKTLKVEIPSDSAHLIVFTDAETPEAVRPNEALELVNPSFVIRYTLRMIEAQEVQFLEPEETGHFTAPEQGMEVEDEPTMVLYSDFLQIELIGDFDELLVIGAISALRAVHPCVMADYLARKMGYNPKFDPQADAPTGYTTEELVEALELLQGEFMVISRSHLREAIALSAIAMDVQESSEDETAEE